MLLTSRTTYNLYTLGTLRAVFIEICDQIGVTNRRTDRQTKIGDVNWSKHHTSHEQNHQAKTLYGYSVLVLTLETNENRLGDFRFEQ